MWIQFLRPRPAFVKIIWRDFQHVIVGLAKSTGQADDERGVKIVCILTRIVRTPLWKDRKDKIAAESKYLWREGPSFDNTAECRVRMIES